MRSGTCAACGGGEPFGIGLCARCGPSHAAGDRLVFVDVKNASERRSLRERFDVMLGGLPGLRPAASGRRALIRLPAALADRVTQQLGHEGVRARAIPLHSAWTRMPPHFFLLVTLAGVVGTLAGVQALPMMLWASPIVAALLLVAAQDGMRQPVILGVRRREGSMAREARLEIALALADLPPGRARDTLGDLIRLADALKSAEPQEEHLDALLLAAAHTAREVDRLEQTCEALALRGVRGDAADRCRSSLDSGIGLLQRALSVLARLASTGTMTVARERLRELVREMEAEAESRAAAVHAISAILGETG